MRTWGFVLIGIGVFYAIAMALALAGGSQMSPIPLVVAVLLVAMGATFARSGTALVKTPPSADAPSPTTELPMSAEISAVVRQQTAKTWRVLLILSGGMALGFILLGAIVGFADQTPGEGAQIFSFFCALGVVMGGTILFTSWLTTRRLINSDVRAANYLRTVGPLQLVPLVTGGAMLRLADRAFLINGRGGVRELKGVTAGTVDYTAKAHVILGAWDANGHELYRAPGYAPTL